MRQTKDIRSLSRPELEKLMVEMGEKRFRVAQVHDWIWKKGVEDFEEMRNVGKQLRSHLAANYTLHKVRIYSSQQSKDKTIKYVFNLPNQLKVEGVLIPTPKRLTACISSQAGCSLDCVFCATGTMDFQYNLKHYEIFDQVALLQQEALLNFHRPLTNIVYMGMGEPLLNYKHVLTSIHYITSEEGMGWSPKRITLSTAGIAKMIKKLGDEEVKFEFALSLHSANEEKRNRIMSINRSNSLEQLKEALTYFYHKTGTRITYEYCLFDKVNDGIEDAAELVEFSRIIPSKVNIIEYNSFPGTELRQTSPKKMQAFISYLETQKVIVNVRRSRGKDIFGACGQLALHHEQKHS